MKITIDIPDVKFDEFNARELLEKNGTIPSEYKDFWNEKLIEENGIYILSIGGVVDGDMIYKEYKHSVEDMNNMFFESINHFEYTGSYGSKIELTSDETPSFYDYQREGSLKTYLEEVVKGAITNGYSYGYCE